MGDHCSGCDSCLTSTTAMMTTPTATSTTTMMTTPLATSANRCIDDADCECGFSCEMGQCATRNECIMAGAVCCQKKHVSDHRCNETLECKQIDTQMFLS